MTKDIKAEKSSDDAEVLKKQIEDKEKELKTIKREMY